MKPVEAQGTPSPHQPTKGVFDWKKVAQDVLIKSILVAIIAKLVDIYLLALTPVQLILLVLGVVMIVIAISMIYDTFARSRS